MKLTFITKEVQEQVAYTLKAKRHDGEKGLFLVRDDGAYIVSTALPRLKDSKNDDKVAYAVHRGEKGRIAEQSWTHIISGTWLSVIMRLKTERFTIVRRNNLLQLVGGEKLRDDEVVKAPKAKRAKKQREPKAKRVPDGYSSLAAIVAGIGGSMTTKKARIMLRKAKKKPVEGWAWPEGEVAAVKAFLCAKPAPKATGKVRTLLKGRRAIRKPKKKTSKKKSAKKSK